MVGRTIGRGVLLLLEPPRRAGPLTCFRFVMGLAGRGLPDRLSAERRTPAFACDLKGSTHHPGCLKVLRSSGEVR